MAILICKGTKIQEDIASTLTDIAQVLSIDGPDPEVETFEADTLDNASAGIPKKPTGRTDGGSVGFEMFFDPSLADHTGLLDLIETPVSKGWALVWSDAVVWPFDGIFKGLSPTVDMADGLKASASIELDWTVTYP